MVFAPESCWKTQQSYCHKREPEISAARPLSSQELLDFLRKVFGSWFKNNCAQWKELTAYHINHWRWQKQEYVMVPVDEDPPPAQAACRGNPVRSCSLEGLLSQQQQWAEPGGGTGLSESCTMTSSHAEVTFVLRDRPPPSGRLRRTWDNHSSTRTPLHWIDHCIHDF